MGCQHIATGFNPWVARIDVGQSCKIQAMHRILLVEDNEMNRDLISRRLKRRGFDVSLAVDGAEGVERATADMPDLIVMDMGLPVLDGYEATRMLKDAEATRRIPIIGLSAHAMSGDARRALDAGCDDYDTKPVDWKRLLGKIDVLLTRAQEVAAAEGAETAAAGAELGDGSAGHVLVVDDNALHREMLSGRLTSLGYSFDLAAGADEALEQLAQKRFDVVLLDVTLPRVDGQPLLEKIRANPRWNGLPVLLLTTIDAVSQAVDSLSQGAEDFIPQPFHKEVLAARLASSLERGRLHRQNQDLEQRLAAESERSRHLLETILPGDLIGELEETRKVLPRRCPAVAVLHGELSGLTAAVAQLDPLDAGQRLQRLTLAFEEIFERHQLEIVASYGGAFTAAAGLFPTSGSASPKDPARIAVRCALELRDAALSLEADWPPRIGIDLGPVIAGAVGHRKTRFDLWGTPVTTAARVRRSEPSGAVYVSEAVWRHVSEHCEGQRLGEARLGDGGTAIVYRVDRLTGH